MSTGCNPRSIPAKSMAGRRELQLGSFLQKQSSDVIARARQLAQIAMKRHESVRAAGCPRHSCFGLVSLGFRQRTPAPPPFSLMNSTPAPSNACRKT